MAHPYGVRPEGNRWADSGVVDCRPGGLGALATLSDPLLVDALSFLSAADLAVFAGASRAAYVLAHAEDVHKAAVLGAYGGDFDFAGGSWRETARAMYLATRPAAAGVRPSRPHVPLRVPGFYSDLLFRAHHVATLPLQPLWLALDNIPRVDAAEAGGGLTPADFAARFDGPGLPVVLTGAMADWAALQRWVQPALPPPPELGGAVPATPTLGGPHGDLVRRLDGDSTGARFDVGSYGMGLRRYVAYARSAREDQPLILFDPLAFAKAPELADDWATPAVFRGDLLTALGPSRPHHRWLIAGPTRSGSVWHVDPNATSAYNALVSGRKLWLMWPPSTSTLPGGDGDVPRSAASWPGDGTGGPPPGVYASADGSHVMQPMSVVEWLLDFYAHAAKEGRANAAAAARADARSGSAAAASSSSAAAASPLTPGRVVRQLYQTVAHPGEVVFVPRGWWHAVLNLGDPVDAGVLTIAVTENFCSPAGLPHVLRFLRDRRGAVSGVSPPERAERFYEEVVSALQAAHPGALADALAVLQREDEAEQHGARGDDGDAPPAAKRPRMAWSAVVGAAAATQASQSSASDAAAGAPASGSGASFSFGFDIGGGS